jgi:hypothetical protein
MNEGRVQQEWEGILCRPAWCVTSYLLYMRPHQYRAAQLQQHCHVETYNITTGRLDMRLRHVAIMLLFGDANVF